MNLAVLAALPSAEVLGGKKMESYWPEVQARIGLAARTAIPGAHAPASTRSRTSAGGRGPSIRQGLSPHSTPPSAANMSWEQH